MKFLLKSTLLIVLFIYSLIALLPKENLYYLLESELYKNKIVITDEKLKDNFINFKIKDGTIFYNDINFAAFKELSSSILIFNNNIEAKNINISDQFRHFIPQKIDFISIKYTITNPNYITIDSKGEFGKLDGYVDILNRNIIINLTASNEMKKKSSELLKFMKSDKGIYKYEYKF